MINYLIKLAGIYLKLTFHALKMFGLIIGQLDLLFGL